MKTRALPLGSIAISRKLAAKLPEWKARYRLKAFGLFGSRVAGRPRSDSDLDVLVRVDDTVSYWELVGLENEISDCLGLKADVVPLADLKSELRARIKRATVFL